MDVQLASENWIVLKMAVLLLDVCKPNNNFLVAKYVSTSPTVAKERNEFHGNTNIFSFIMFEDFLMEGVIFKSQ